jgi:hypothetical protein
MINENDPPAGSGQPSQDIKRTAQDAARAGAERLGGLKESAQAGIEDAKSAAVETTERAKTTAADEISRTAEGLEAAARELEGSPQHELLHEAAEGLKQISHAIDGKSIGELVSELSDFGRRNPLAYLGGAAFAGFALARFARASAAGPDDAGPFRAASGHGSDFPRPARTDPTPGVPYGGGPQNA